MSSTITTLAIFHPITRKTFVAPRLPEPCSRRSIPLKSFPARNANGIEPARYAINNPANGSIYAARLRNRIRSGLPLNPHASRKPLCR